MLYSIHSFFLQKKWSIWTWQHALSFLLWWLERHERKSASKLKRSPQYLRNVLYLFVLPFFYIFSSANQNFITLRRIWLKILNLLKSNLLGIIYSVDDKWKKLERERENYLTFRILGKDRVIIPVKICNANSSVILEEDLTHEPSKSALFSLLWVMG